MHPLFLKRKHHIVLNLSIPMSHRSISLQNFPNIPDKIDSLPFYQINLHNGMRSLIKVYRPCRIMPKLWELIFSELHELLALFQVVIDDHHYFIIAFLLMPS